MADTHCIHGRFTGPTGTCPPGCPPGAVPQSRDMIPSLTVVQGGSTEPVDVADRTARATAHLRLVPDMTVDNAVTAPPALIAVPHPLDDIATGVHDRASIDPTATVSSDALVTDSAVVGPHSHVGDGTWIGGSAVLTGATVTGSRSELSDNAHAIHGAQVNNSIMWDRATADGPVTVEDSWLRDDARVTGRAIVFKTDARDHATVTDDAVVEGDWRGTTPAHLTGNTVISGHAHLTSGPITVHDSHVGDHTHVHGAFTVHGGTVNFPTGSPTFTDLTLTNPAITSANDYAFTGITRLGLSADLQYRTGNGTWATTRVRFDDPLPDEHRHPTHQPVHQ